MDTRPLVEQALELLHDVLDVRKAVAIDALTARVEITNVHDLTPRLIAAGEKLGHNLSVIVARGNAMLIVTEQTEMRLKP
jgi:hypothetical protein